MHSVISPLCNGLVEFGVEYHWMLSIERVSHGWFLSLACCVTVQHLAGVDLAAVAQVLGGCAAVEVRVWCAAPTGSECLEARIIAKHPRLLGGGQIIKALDFVGVHADGFVHAPAPAPVLRPGQSARIVPPGQPHVGHSGQ